MRIGAVVLAFLCLFAEAAPAQDSTPVVRARSRTVTITDGLHVKKNYWHVMPEKSPDVYYVEIPRRPAKVTFATDLDSISFDVDYGARRRFVVQLDDGAAALTEIRAEYRTPPSLRPAPADAAGAPVTIPFTLGDNDKIYVKGRINGGPELDLQLDLGAGGSIIKKASVSRVQMTFDTSITLHNSDGTNVVPASSRNRLEIAAAVWDDVHFAVADNMTHREDGLVGNTLFRDRVLEIDYDRMLISIHETMPALAGEWRREDVALDGGTVPFVRGSLAVGDDVRSGWFMLDTGAYTSILNSERLGSTSKFAGEARRLLGPLAGEPRGPRLSIAGHTFTNINYSVRNYDGDAPALGLMGNDVLKRFNTILDNRQGVVYFRPSGRMQDEFRNPERTLTRALAGGLILTLAAVLWRTRRRPRLHRA